MLWVWRLWMRLQTFFRRPQVARQLDDEIQFHLDHQIAENVAAGMSREEARHAALQTFGNPTVLKEETRETWGWMWLEQIARDLRYATRNHSGDQRKARLRRTLLSVEVGLTVVLLIAAGLLLKSYKTLRNVDLGCITQNVLTMHVALPDARYHAPIQKKELFERLIAEVRRLPGVPEQRLEVLL